MPLRPGTAMRVQLVHKVPTRATTLTHLFLVMRRATMTRLTPARIAPARTPDPVGGVISDRSAFSVEIPLTSSSPESMDKDLLPGDRSVNRVAALSGAPSWPPERFLDVFSLQLTQTLGR